MKLCISILTLLFSFHLLSQNNKCYDERISPIETVSVMDTLIEYTGNDNKNPLVKYIEVNNPAGTKWVKKAGNANCLSPDPNDCLVWCLVDVKELIYTYYTVLDTFTLKDFRFREIDNNRKITLGGKYQKIEILCKDKITVDVVNQIEKVLIDDGYTLKLSNKNKVSKKVMGCIKAYQDEYNLPIGTLNIETLQHMGIKY